MAKFRLNNDSVITIGGTAVSCVVSVELSETVDEYISDCENASGFKEIVYGGEVVRGTIEFEIEDTGVTQLNALAPGSTGAFVLQPAGTGTGKIDIDSTNIKLGTRDMEYTRTGLATGSVQFTLDDLTISAQA